MNKITFFNKLSMKLTYFIDLFKYDIPWFFRNLWWFRKVLWNHRTWDFYHTLQLMHISLTLIKKDIDEGYEIEETKDKKVFQIQRTIELLNNFIEDDFIKLAEKVHGEMIIHPWKTKKLDDGNYELIDQDTAEERKYNKIIIDSARKLEEEQWKELWRIISGYNTESYKSYFKKHSTGDIEKDNELYYKYLNGSDARSWWS